MKKQIKLFLNSIWGVMDFMMEFLNQIAYIGFITSAVLILFNAVPLSDALIYTASLIMHLIILAFFGYKKFWNYMEDDVAIISFVIFTFLLIAITAVLTTPWITILLYFCIFFMGSIYIHFTERLICVSYCKKRPFLEKIFSKNPIFWYFLLLLIPIISVIVPLIYLPWNIFIKIVIVLCYIIFMPLIAMAADNGFDLREIIDM